MNIQFYPDELDWVNAQMHNRDPHDTSFIGAVLQVALRADPENYELFRPFLNLMMAKYPADPARLEIERMDRERF